MRPRDRDVILSVVTVSTDLGGHVMVRYFYLCTPLVIVSSVALLALPWFGLIALGLVFLVTAAALAWAIVFVPFVLSRALIRVWRSRARTSLRTTATVLLAHGPSETHTT
jgi:hypothetical protein